MVAEEEGICWINIDKIVIEVIILNAVASAEGFLL